MINKNFEILSPRNVATNPIIKPVRAVKKIN
jgi:hypothetical protein